MVCTTTNEDDRVSCVLERKTKYERYCIGFNISRIQATRDIKRYVEMYPGNIYYDGKKRAYIKAEPFHCHITKGTVDEYLLAFPDTVDVPLLLSELKESPFEQVAAPLRCLPPSVVAPLLDSIRANKGVSIRYASMTSPEGADRIVFPHSLVDTGFRWHLRAYCGSRGEFRDFNLGRIKGSPVSKKPSPACAAPENDKMWNEIVTFNLKANPALTDSQRSMIEIEFGFKHGSLAVTSRACLIHYMLQRYQVDSRRLEGEQPTSRLLVVENPSVIAPYLFEGG